MDFSAALPTFVVTLREGFEASLVVGIVLACLKKANQTELNRWVYQGIGGGITASVILGLFLRQILLSLETSPVIKELLEGIFGLVAIAMLSWMLIWMTQQATSLKSEVEGTIKGILTDNNAGRAILLLVFIAVLREGFETVLFIVAKFQEGIIAPSVGAIAGLITAVAIAVLLFQWGVKINIRLFFQVMGILLLLIVGGLVVGALKHFDAALSILSQLDSQYASWCIYQGNSCLLGSLVWDASEILPDKKFPGIILKSLFGYREKIYLVQAVAYVIFLITVGTTYLQSIRGQENKKVLSNAK